MANIALNSISLTNCGKHHQLDIDFAQSNVIQGSNWAGKSTIKESILVGLFGHQATSVNEFIRRGAKNYKIVLTLSDGTVITRSKNDATVEFNGEVQAVGQTAVNEHLVIKFGISYSQFMTLHTLSFDTIGEFLNLQGTNFTKLVENLLGLDSAETLINQLNGFIYQKSAELRAIPDTVVSAEDKPLQVSLETLETLREERKSLSQTEETLGKTVTNLEESLTITESSLSNVTKEIPKLELDLGTARELEGKLRLIESAIQTREERLLTSEVVDLAPIEEEMERWKGRHGRITDDIALFKGQLFELESNQKRFISIQNQIDALRASMKARPAVDAATCAELIQYWQHQMAYDTLLAQIHACELSLDEDQTDLHFIQSKIEPDADLGYLRLEVAKLLAHEESLRLQMEQPDVCITCGQDIPHVHTKEAVADEAQAVFLLLSSRREELRKAEQTHKVNAERHSQVRVLETRIKLSETRLTELQAALGVTPSGEGLPLGISSDQARAMLKIHETNQAVEDKVSILIETRPVKVCPTDISAVIAVIESQQAAEAQNKLEYDRAWTQHTLGKERNSEAEKVQKELCVLKGNLEGLLKSPLISIGSNALATELQARREQSDNLGAELSRLKTLIASAKNQQLQFGYSQKILQDSIRKISNLLDTRYSVEMQLAQAKEILSIVKTVKDKVTATGFVALNSEASRFASTVSGGDIETVSAWDKFTYTENGEVLSKDRASGGQKSIIALAIKQGLRALSNSKLNVLLLDEALGTLRDDNSERVMDAVHNLDSQTVSITHRLEVAENVISL